MVIDMCIAGRLDLQIDQAMATDLLQHVIQEGNARRDAAVAKAIQPKLNVHIGLAGDTVNLPSAHA